MLVAKALYIFSFILVLTLVILSLYKSTHLSDLEIIKIQTRRDYFPESSARIFENKITESFTFTRKQVFGYISFDKAFEVLNK